VGVRASGGWVEEVIGKVGDMQAQQSGTHTNYRIVKRVVEDIF